MGAHSRAKWNSRAKRYQELMDKKGKSAADAYRATFDKQPQRFHTDIRDSK